METLNKKKSPAEPSDNLDDLKKVFVISPIGSPGTEKHRKATLALDYIIKKALPDDAWEVTRGDGSLSPDSIGHDIIKRINDAQLIVADLTDHNANVFYELAIAHGWKKPVIHMIERGQSIPFDISDLRVVAYDLSDPASVDETITTISGMSIEAMKGSYKPVTPLSQYEAFETVTGSADPESAQAEMNLQILNRLSSIEESIRERSTKRPNMEMRRLRELDQTDQPMLKFVSLAGRVHMMTKDRDDYDVLEIKAINNSLSKLWFSMNNSARNEAVYRLKKQGTPFPDIVDVSGMTVTDISAG